jgi:hypothetical protein
MCFGNAFFAHHPILARCPVAGCWVRLGNVEGFLSKLTQHFKNAHKTNMLANVALARLTTHAKVFKGDHGVDASSSDMIAAGEFSFRSSNILTPDFIYFPSKSMLDRCASANAAVEDLVTNCTFLSIISRVTRARYSCGALLCSDKEIFSMLYCSAL